MAETVKAQQINLRCTIEEEDAIEGAAKALGVGTSHLVEVGLTQAVVDLGMQLLDDTPPRLRPDYQWPFTPQRPEGESAKTRITAYVSALLFPTVETAAWALRLSMPAFAIGATLRQIALAKVINERRQKSEPKKFNAELAKVAVPYSFDELIKTRH